MTVKPLAAERLCLKTDPCRLPFDSTECLPEPDGPVGQDRAMRAVAFGAGIAHPGYNIFVTGLHGSGKRSSVGRAVERLAAAMPVPRDWCYVHNFAMPHRPMPLGFAPGEGARFQRAMAAFVAALKSAMPKLFDSEEYRMPRNAIEDERRKVAESAVEQLRRQAEAQGLSLLEKHEGGFDFATRREGVRLLDTDTRQAPSAAHLLTPERHRELRIALESTLKTLTTSRERSGERMRALDRELGEAEVKRLMQPLVDAYRTHGEASAYLDAVFRDILAHIGALQAYARGKDRDGDRAPSNEALFHRYEVNLLVDNANAKGAPVVTLNMPTLSRLLGKVEHVPLLVTTITDFMFVRPGALHAANGGFLLIDALALLQQDMSWTTLKQALREAQIRIANLSEILDRSVAVSVQPLPIPLDVKVVLFGEAWLYYRLREIDPDFAEFFKVQADFSAIADRDDANCSQLLAVLASVSRSGGLKHLDRTGAARMIDEAARLAGDAEKISVRVLHLADLLREADHFATGRTMITAGDVARAVDAKEDRAGRIKALQRELVQRGIVYIDTEGAKVGQINVLTVMSVAGFSFGAPARVTAQVRPGNGGVADVERLVEFGGPAHAKGVHILTGYLNGYYSLTRPLSLSASVAFEQSYGRVDGDSASAAELIAILSAIADVPLNQGIAITGSVDQRGRIQPIGGANEKIEGFFDICALRGLDAGQGVVIPKVNTANLMLRDDVLGAVRQGRFAVYAVETVSEALEILTGMKTGQRRKSGRFPRGSFNARVAERLDHFARPRILRPLRLGGIWPF